jgi:hypothetical protein
VGDLLRVLPCADKGLDVTSNGHLVTRHSCVAMQVQRPARTSGAAERSVEHDTNRNSDDL